MLSSFGPPRLPTRSKSSLIYGGLPGLHDKSVGTVELANLILVANVIFRHKRLFLKMGCPVCGAPHNNSSTIFGLYQGH